MSGNLFEPVLERARAEASRRLARAAAFLAGEVKKVLSVPAPRVKVTSKKGSVYYRATTKATPGAPPRKLSGRLRASVAWDMPDAETARVGASAIYARRLEYEGHPWLYKTFQAQWTRIEAILNGAP